MSLHASVVAVCCRRLLLQGVAGCCRVLQGVAGCCSVLQCVEVCCSVLKCVAGRGKGTHGSRCYTHGAFVTLPRPATHCNTLQHILQHTATQCNTMQHTATAIACNTTQQHSNGSRCHVHVAFVMFGLTWWVCDTEWLKHCHEQVIHWHERNAEFVTKQYDSLRVWHSYIVTNQSCIVTNKSYIVTNSVGPTHCQKLNKSYIVTNSTYPSSICSVKGERVLYYKALFAQIGLFYRNPSEICWVRDNTWLVAFDILDFLYLVTLCCEGSS